MKKLFALFLILAMLVPMALAANAAESTPEVTADPFYMLGWSDFNEEKFPYMAGLVTVTVRGDDGIASLNFPDAGKIFHGNIDEAILDAMAKAVKAEMDSRPEGLRYLKIFAPTRAFKIRIDNVLFLDYGVNQLRDLTDAFLKKYKEIGGSLTGIVIDTEYTGMSAFYIKRDNASKDPLIYKKIVEDPRYKTEIRPLLAERGFKFYDKISDYTPEIYGITGNAGPGYEDCEAIWNTVTGIHLRRYGDIWCYEPMLKYFPDATLSDYQSADSAAWLKGVDSDGNITNAIAGNSTKIGNVSNQSFYHIRPSNEFFEAFPNPVSYNDAVYEASPYNRFLFDINQAKRMYAATDTKMISAWIARYDYSPKREGTISNTAYYSELMFHLGMLDPEPFLGYMYPPEFKDEAGNASVEVFEDRCNVVNELMMELTKVAGFSDRKVIEVPATWNSEFVLSGMYANGRNIWRLTPNQDEISLENFKVTGDDLTFCVKGQTITFPGGKIIEDGTISHVGTYGFWVETAADVTPIIKNDADRYEKYPTYKEDYESYTIGTELDTTTVRPQGAWMIQPKGSALTVVADGENKALSITGNSLMQCKLLPANITIGDSYAKEQSWEITVTVPAGITAEETLTLLDFTANKQSAKDGGFQITGGKVYYSKLGPADEKGKATQEYAELMDISAGGKFTFKRALNFNNAEYYTCDYIVLDAAGKEVASAKAVSIPTFTETVTALGITCKKVTGAVLVDNFILRALGVAADFELYDAVIGLHIDDVDTPQATSTAYRLSWMNAGDKEETATVMAAIYEGDKKVSETAVKEVKLAPGYDGVETGIVEIQEGQTVKVYLQSSIKPSSPSVPNGDTNPTEPGNKAPTEPTTPGNSTSPSLTIVIAVVAAIVIVAVVVLVVIKKKSGKKA